MRRLEEKYRDLWIAFEVSTDPKVREAIAKKAWRVYRQLVRGRR